MQIGRYSRRGKAQKMMAPISLTILTDKSKRGEIKNYIPQFLYDTGYTVDGYSMKQVTDRLFSEMAEYSFLTPIRMIRTLRKSTSTVGTMLHSPILTVILRKAMSNFSRRDTR